jgi:hypothetical protein
MELVDPASNQIRFFQRGYALDASDRTRLDESRTDASDMRTEVMRIS